MIPTPTHSRAWSRIARSLSLGACALLATPLAVFAQDDDEANVIFLPMVTVTAQDTEGYRLSTSITSAGVPEALIDNEKVISFVTDEFIEDLQFDDLTEAFQYSASISTNPEGAFRNNNLFIRGFETDFVLQDGFKKYYRTDLAGVDRIEVVKGPNAVFFGRAEPGGVINLISKRPQSSPKQQLTLKYGEDKRYQVTVDSTGPLTPDKMFTYRVIADYLDSESWRFGTDLHTEYVNAQLQWTPFPNNPDRLLVRVGYEYSDVNQSGGVNSALVHNTEFVDDYYDNSGTGRFGYTQNLDPSVYNVNSDVRYPDPEVYPDIVAAVPPELFTVNPRWEGSGFDQSVFPEQQRNVTQRYQNPIIELGSSGNSIATVSDARGYQKGWRVAKYIDSDWERYPPRFNGQYFPRGFNWQPNGPESKVFNEHHIVNANLDFNPFEWVYIRYGFNYLENKFLRYQQFNSDTDQDGFALNPYEGWEGQFASGAAGDDFYNAYYTHQAQVNFQFEVGPTKHTFTLLYEYRDDTFRQYRIAQSDYWRENVQVGNSPVPGLGVYDLFVDPSPNIGLWYGGRTGSGQPFYSESNSEEGYSFRYVGKFFNERLALFGGVRHENRTTFPTAALPDEERGAANTGRRNGTTPSAGLNFKLIDAVDAEERRTVVALFATYSESFQPPTGNSASSYAQPVFDSQGNPIILGPDGERVVFKVEPTDLNGNGVIDDDNGEQDGQFFDAQTNEPVVMLQNGVYVPADGITFDSNVTPVSLDNEVGRGYEGGFKFDYKGIFSGTATLFHLEKDKIVIRNASLTERLNEELEELEEQFPTEENWLNTINPEFDPDLGQPLLSNSGLRLVEGLELDVQASPVTGWDVLFGLSWLFTREISEPEVTDFFGDPSLPPGTTDGPWAHPSLFVKDYEPADPSLPPGPDNIKLIDPSLGPIEGNRVLTNPNGDPIEQYRPKTQAELEATEIFGEPVYLPKQHTELAAVPEYQFYFWNRYTVQDEFFGMDTGFMEGFYLGAGFSYFSSRLPNQERESDYRNAAYAVWDALIGYKFDLGDSRYGRQLDLKLTVNNLFDRRVIQNGSFGIIQPRRWTLAASYTY